jgi:methionyl aminopeptidase
MLMSLYSKSPAQLDAQREASQIVAGALNMVAQHVKVGITSLELDRLCHEYIESHSARPACVGYHGYQHASCISVNHVVCHGIPNTRALKDGDILNIDLVAEKGGMHGDSSAMFCVGQVDAQAQRLVEATRKALYVGIAQVRPGARVGDIGAAIQAYAESQRYSVVRDYCGHGIGSKMHQDPEIRHYGKPNTGAVLMPGMTFTIEPMLNAGKEHVRLLGDGWTVITRDRSLSAQWEHTILVTDSGCEILTLRDGEVSPQ